MHFYTLTWLYVHVFECACKHISKVCKQFNGRMIRYSVREYIILLIHTCVKLLFTKKKKKRNMYFGDDSILLIFYASCIDYLFSISLISFKHAHLYSTFEWFFNISHVSAKSVREESIRL